MIDQPSHTVEAQMVGEIDRRRMEAEAAVKRAIEATERAARKHKHQAKPDPDPEPSTEAPVTAEDKES